MAAPTQSSRWRRFRVIFRRCRITALLVILAGTVALVYLDKVGLPGFIKRPLLENLHAHGLDLQFSRLRWLPFRGIVADNVFFGTTNAASPRLDLKEVDVELNYPAFFKRQLQIQSLALRQGRLAIPVADTNDPPRELSIDHIQTDLQLLTNDVWELDNLQAQFAGAKIQLTGALTNASAIREWKVFHGAQPPPRPEALQNQLRRLADVLEKIHFASAPELKLDVRGDARNIENLTVRLSLEAPDADTPWGTLRDADCSVLLAPPPSNQLSRAELTLCASSAATDWAAVTNLSMTLHLFSLQADTNVVMADLDFTVDSAQFRSNRAEQIHLTGQWLHSLGNFAPLSGEGELQARNVVTQWGIAKQFHLAGMLKPLTNSPSPDASWAWWAKLASFPLQLDGSATGVHSPKLDADQILCSGEWHAPELTIQKLSAKLYDGKLDASAKLNVATRVFTFNSTSDFDAQRISPLLTPQAQSWMANYSWYNPPRVQATGSLILPASVWTNRHPDWQNESRPTLRLDGEFHVVDGAFRGVPVSTADSHFTYSNMCWNLPDLVATRPEGNLSLYHESNDRTKDYYFRVRSRIDPHALRPLFTPYQQRAFDLFTVSQPPLVEGEIRGRWLDFASIHASARVTATNFAIRGQSVDTFQTTVEYTNRTLTLLEPVLWRARTQQLAAATVILALDQRRILVTNGFSTADPAVVAHAIGPQIESEFKPYQFPQPPTAHIEGAIPLRDERDADLHFDLDGRAFAWWKFQMPRVSAKIDWVGQHLSIKNAQASFYLGKASGNADFDFKKDNRSADFRFNADVTNANIHLLARDFSDGKTNNLEGLLTARLNITKANSADLQSAMGTGRASLRDGLIWDIPVFGIFSPVLDTIMPGLGSSRAREGSATFTITNSVFHSDDLKIETLMARLRYWGTIDLNGNLNARMEAEILRNTWVVGPVISLVLWPVSKTFEYSISGSISHPKSDPVYIPRILFLPVHPVQTLKDMVPEQTNSVPSAVPPSKT